MKLICISWLKSKIEIEDVGKLIKGLWQEDGYKRNIWKDASSGPKISVSRQQYWWINAPSISFRESSMGCCFMDSFEEGSHIYSHFHVFFWQYSGIYPLIKRDRQNIVGSDVVFLHFLAYPPCTFLLLGLIWQNILSHFTKLNWLICMYVHIYMWKLTCLWCINLNPTSIFKSRERVQKGRLPLWSSSKCEFQLLSLDVLILASLHWYKVSELKDWLINMKM